MEEADEAGFWLEMIEEADLMQPDKLALLRQESEALIRIFAKSRRTASQSSNRSTAPPSADESS